MVIPIEEFRILDRYAYAGRIWTLIQKPTPDYPVIIKQRTIEYIFDPEALTVFCIVSQNILATWDTDCTKYLGPDEEFYLKDSLFIKHYQYIHI
jgi:hypothetical protein